MACDFISLLFRMTVSLFTHYQFHYERQKSKLYGVLKSVEMYNG